MWATLYSDAYLSGQQHVFGAPRKLLGNGTAVGTIYAAGGGGTATSWQTSGTATNPQETNELVEAVVDRTPGWDPAYRMCSFATDWTWGNDTAIDRIQNLYTYAQANHGYSNLKVHLIAVSMGCTCVLNWAYTYPNRVASISILLPAVDIRDIEANGRATAVNIPAPSTAFGDVDPPVDHNPASHPGAYKDMPVKIWYSTNDTICVPDTVTAFGAACGAEMVSLGDQPPQIGIPGHSLNAGFDPISVREWLDEN